MIEINVFKSLKIKNREDSLYTYNHHLTIMKNLISVPKPCNEDWNAMTPEGIGRFCNVCTKTVTDFTGMTAVEIQTYLQLNSGQQICGRFKTEQLDNIIIRIPEKVLFSQTQFRKIFLLALLVTMGTTLLSCTGNNGRQVIGEVAIDSDTIHTVDSITLPTPTPPSLKPLHPKPEPYTTGAIAMPETIPNDELMDKIAPPPQVKQEKAHDSILKDIKINPDSNTKKE
jgi:hypothetical protein